MIELIGKYEVVDVRYPKHISKIITDNPLEAVWEANKFPKTRTINNICGEAEIYQEDGKWKVRRS